MFSPSPPLRSWRHRWPSASRNSFATSCTSEGVFTLCSAWLLSGAKEKHLKAHMPLPPARPFMKSTCQACGWQVITHQQSDALFLPGRCKDCGSGPLSHSAAGQLEGLAAKPVEFLRDLLRSIAK